MRIKPVFLSCLFVMFVVAGIMFHVAPANAFDPTITTPIVKVRPDLMVRNIEAQITNCTNVIRLSVTVINKGLGSAEMFRVQFQDGTFFRITKLAPGESVTEQVSFNGDSLVTAFADSLNEIEESDETNNNLTVTVTMPAPVPTCTPGPTRTPTHTPEALPDLIIDAIYPAAAAVCGVDEPRTAVKVLNQGSVVAESFMVSLNNQNVQYVQALAPGESKVLFFDVFGDFTMTAVADSTNAVVEINENNNQKSALLPYPAPSTCVPSPTKTATSTLTPMPSRTPTNTPMS